MKGNSVYLRFRFENPGECIAEAGLSPDTM
ncbi:hypothetical protein PAYE108092_07135 [Paracoccus yeei]